MKKEIESNAEEISSIARRNHTHSQTLRRAYKEAISSYKEYYKSHERMFTDQAFVFPENFGERIGIDETSLVGGEYYTIIYNKDKKGRKGCLAAIIKGTRGKTVVKHLNDALGLEQIFNIREVSLDGSQAVDWIARSIAPNAIKVIDRFHIERIVSEALQAVRIKHRWKALEKENQRKAEKQKQAPKTFANGDTERQLLARSRALLFKRSVTWTSQQRLRAKILFEAFPDIRKAYELYEEFKDGFTLNELIAEEHFLRWARKVAISGLKEMKTAANSVIKHLRGILYYIATKTTNAALENFNAKLKLFRAKIRGINDPNLFFYRIIQLYA